MKKVHNFSAGPCILPQEVLKKASEAVVNFDDLNLSLIEISHRSKNVVAVMEKAQNLVRELLNVPANYEILFLQGGASLGFYTAALNYLSKDGKAVYVNTGTWAKKAIKEAKLVGNIEVVASSEDDGFKYIPKGFNIPADADFLHITTNNTIYGTQYPEIPKSPVPIIADMSSDIFSRPVNVSDYAMIYAGAQKNMGPAGTTLFIVNKDLLGKTGRTIPSMLDYQLHIDKESMYNTPPVFPIYVSMLTLDWLKNLGGVPAIEKINAEKAAAMYAEIDRNPLFVGYTAVEDRSKMNATFNLVDDTHKELFDSMWKEAGISGINGHRSVGGYRASMYNALPLESVQALVKVMQEFEEKVSVKA
ncbi:3-phosphoserine/phosphohydroxythreonine transaminase [Luteibaculum oceani]|uniref:Phosphoserine aminotransferase n=1 Tax=Luteibaculum oceani TaxID=1294296 RepID=A0A5C6UVE8_9FLAO|nr:3-phosphoserine/phosphohydroxythreonine transaminase [Luteibaculum oceani]TXC76939.1 3-phosphoserine/phosphohydroxythreonine transaminase [Luteibaculum oceani]